MMRKTAFCLVAVYALLFAAGAQALFLHGGATSGGGALTEIGSGVTFFNNGSTGTNVPVRFGYGFARGDMPLGNTLVVQDDSGNTLAAQIDQISTRTGMSGATDTPGWIHAVISVIEPSWTASTSRTFHVYRQRGSYSPGAGLSVSNLTTGHQYQVLFNNVKDFNNTTVGSGNFTCDLNAAISAGARTAAGGYDVTYDGSVATVVEAVALAIDNSSHTADGQLVCEFFATMWQTTPGSGTLGNVQIVARLSQPWQNATSPTPRAVWGDAQVYDAATTTVLRDYTSTTNFAPSDVLVSPNGSFGNGTIVNNDSTQAGEALSFSTSTGTLPTGLSSCTPCFAMTAISSNAPGRISLTRNAALASVNSQVTNADYVSITSTGSCPAGSCLQATRHVAIDQWSGAWLAADDKGHPFWVGSNIAQLYPALTTAQRDYWETTALVPPLVVSGFISAPPNPWQLTMGTLGAGGPLYRPHSLGPQEANISGGGIHMGLGEWGNLQADWFMTQSVANFDIMTALALTQSNAYAHVVLNQATGYITAFDGGPYPAGGNYTKIGAGQPTSFNIGQNSNGQYTVGFSSPQVPTWLTLPYLSLMGPFVSGANAGNSPMSHEPDYGVAAMYTITGEPHYLRATQMQTNWAAMAGWPASAASAPSISTNTNRNLTIGGHTYYQLLFNQGDAPRQGAWALRDIEKSAVLGGDSDPQKAVMWSYFRDYMDGWYAYWHVYWAAGDANFESMPVLDFPRQVGLQSWFMYPYSSGGWATAYAKTRYSSGSLAGATALYGANLSVQFLTNLFTSWSSTIGGNGSGVTTYWATSEEGSATVPFTASAATPGAPAVASSMAGVGWVQNGASLDSWRASQITTAGVVTPQGLTNTSLLQNGDEFFAAAVSSFNAPTILGTAHYYAINVNRTVPSMQLSTTSPLTQACSGPTGSTGCPAAFIPSIGVTTVLDLAARPQATVAPPAAIGGQNTDTSGYMAEFTYAFVMAQNAGATVPNLGTALTNAQARYNPSALSQLGLSWYVKPVTIP